MSAFRRFLLGWVAFMVVWSVGWLVFHIHPTLAEALLVVVACTVSDAVTDR